MAAVELLFSAQLIGKFGARIVAARPVSDSEWHSLQESGGNANPLTKEFRIRVSSPASVVELAYPESGTYSFKLEPIFDQVRLATREIRVGSAVVTDPETKQRVDWRSMSIIHVGGTVYDEGGHGSFLLRSTWLSKAAMRVPFPCNDLLPVVFSRCQKTRLKPSFRIPRATGDNNPLRNDCALKSTICSSEQGHEHHAQKCDEHDDTGRAKEIKTLPVREAKAVVIKGFIKPEVIHAAINRKITTVFFVKPIFPDLGCNLLDCQKADCQQRGKNNDDLEYRHVAFFRLKQIGLSKANLLKNPAPRGFFRKSVF